MQILPLDDSSGVKAYVAIGSTGRCLRLCEATYRLIRARSAGLSFEEISAAMGDRTRVSPGELETIVTFITSVVERVDNGDKPKSRGCLLSRSLIPRSAVRRISAHLTWMYHPLCVGAVAALMVAAVGIDTRSLYKPFARSDMLCAYVMFVASMLWHEFGHASACVLFDVQPGDIGAALYIVYPSLYSEVSDVWRLRRWQRVVVDIAGSYFQLSLGVVSLWAYAVSGWLPFKGLFVLTATAAFVSMNPLFRFDGYWVLSDLLGVPNLASRSRHAVWAIFRGREDPRTRVSRRPLITALVIVYGIAGTVLWAWFIVHVWPKVIWTRLTRYPDAVARALASIRFGGWPTVEMVTALLFNTLLLYGSALLAIRGVKALHGVIRLCWRAAKTSCISEGDKETDRVGS